LSEEAEGIINITPRPYIISISKSPIYTWEEILKDLCEVAKRLIKEESDKLSTPGAGKDKTGT
jgi:hypothetical protein